MEFETRTDLSEAEFLTDYVARNRPVVVRGIPYAAERWSPAAVTETLGDLMVQIYDTLFDLEDISFLEDYMEEHFGADRGADDYVPYVRWYNTLKDAEMPWCDEAFERMSAHWKKPDCVPSEGLYVPPAVREESGPDPVTDLFPYRGIMVAAQGARTRLHRDPFCSDAVVSMFHGTKEVALYHPSRTDELSAQRDSSSFGGFIDVRGESVSRLSVAPDYHGVLRAGDMVYIPHGWLHDVIVTGDSISVTWNFVHENGAADFLKYLDTSPENDSEFEILQYFFALAGHQDASPAKIKSLCMSRVAA